MAPNLVFDIAFTLLLVEEAKGAVNDSVAKNFLFFGLLLLFVVFDLVLFYLPDFSRKAGRLEGWKGWNTVVIHRLALWLCDEIELMLPRSEKIRLPALAISNATLTSSFCGIM